MKKRFFVLLGFTFALSNFFTSCSFLGNDINSSSSEKKEYSVSGNITGLGFDGQKSESNSRTAFPDLSDVTTINYTITAVKSGATPVTATCASTTPSFELKIPSAGEWTVSAEGFNSESKKILSTIEYTLIISDATPSARVNLEAKPVVTEGGKGYIDLSYTLSGTSIIKVDFICSDENWKAMVDDLNLNITTDDVKGGGLKSGSYTVDINFYKKPGTEYELCYSCTQVINVYDGLTTNTWVKHGSEPYLEYNTSGSQTPGSAAYFKLTEDLLNQFTLTSFYVDTAYDESGTGVKGSWLNPYKSFDEAYAYVYSNLDSIKDATIYVKGKASDNYKVPVSAQILQNKLNTSLTIKSWDIEHPAVLTRAEGLTSDTFVKNSSTLKLQNLVLDGTNNINGKGCIQNLDSVSSLELTGVTIRNFFANGNDGSTNVNGGGIFISYGTVTLNNVTIENCSAKSGGGAIYQNGGTLKITGKTIIKDNHIASVNAGTGALEKKSLNNVELSSVNISISSTGTGSSIGVTKVFASATDNTVNFATDTTTDLAEKYFSDEGYLIANVSNKASIIRSSGTLTGGVYDDVKFVADETEFETGEEACVTFTVQLDAATDSVALSEWDATVMYAGIDISSRVTSQTSDDKKSYNISLPDTFPEGKYYVTITGKYNNLAYSGSQIITLISPYPVDSFNGLQSALNDNTISSIKLTEDISCTETLEVSREVRLSSANKSISCSSDYVFTVKSGANLTLRKITFGSGKAALNIESGGEVTLDSGTVVSPNGNVVPITTSGTLNIKDGAIIKDNTDRSSTKACGALYVSAGTVNMTGGEISNNESNTDATAKAGTVRINGSSAVFNMSGGTVKGNYAMTGSAFYVAQGTLNISGSAKITENRSGSGNYGTVTLYNISGRNGNYYATVNMSGGEITGNTCFYGKAGVKNDGGCFNMTGGCISGNGDSTNSGADFILYAGTNNTKFSGVGAVNATIGKLYIQDGYKLDWNPESVTIENFDPGTSGFTYP